MVKNLLLGICLTGGAAIAGACPANADKSGNDSTADTQSEQTAAYIRLNCVYNVDNEHAADATALARQLIEASQTDDGEIEYDMYESATRPGHFIIYETWKDQPSLDTHSASSHFTTIVPQMQAIAPLTVERFEKNGLNAAGDGQIRINCMFSAKDGEKDSLLDTAKKLVAASQTDEGMIDYDVYISVTRPEHFMIFETWKDKASLDAHSAASHFTTLVPRLHELSATSNTDIFYF